ncbi:MAG TPA: FecR domain-containing protein, partial [Myxococcales bacterium]|nr:FecR domain-containing protein [Myxococcales bacterium]
MRPLFAFAITLLICGAAVAQTTSGAQRTMTATVVDGAVILQRADGTVQTLRSGTLLREGDVLQTGADSRVEMALSDGSTLRLGENAKFEVRVSPPSGKVFSARLWLGAVWAQVHKLLQDEAFQVETENAVAGVRGTEFTVESRSGGEDAVRVYSGTV